MTDVELGLDLDLNLEQQNELVPRTKLTRDEMIQMIFCPFQHLKEPTTVARDCYLFCHEEPNHHLLEVPPMVEIGGTWLSPFNPVNKSFIKFRICVLIFVFYCAILSLIDFKINGYTKYYLYSFSEWNTIIAVILTITKLLSSIIVYKHINNPSIFVEYSPDNDNDSLTILYRESLSNIDTKTFLWKLYTFHKIILMISLPSMMMITFYYWLFVFNGHFVSIFNAISTIQIHVALSVVLLFDYLISSERLYYKSFLWSFLFGIVYTFWSIIFAIFTNINELNENNSSYLYVAYNWSQPMMSIGYFFLSLMLLVVFLTILTAIKNFILIKSAIADFKITLETDISDKQETNLLL